MNPFGAWVEMLLPLPTTLERTPRRGGIGMGGAFVHGTSCHAVFGYSTLKQPFFGRGVRAMSVRQASLRDASIRSLASSEADVRGWPEAPMDHRSPHRRHATTMMPRTLVPPARVELKK